MSDGSWGVRKGKGQLRDFSSRSLIPLLMVSEALICQGPLWSSAGIQMLLSSGHMALASQAGLHPHLGGAEGQAARSVLASGDQRLSVHGCGVHCNIAGAVDSAWDPQGLEGLKEMVVGRLN